MDQLVRARLRRVPARTGARRPTQRGFSMVEVLIAIAITGMLLTGIISGFFTTVAASTRTERRSGAVSVLASVSERAQVLPYVPCSTLAAMRDAVAGVTRPARYTVVVESVAYLAPPPADPPAGGAKLQTFTPTCSTDQGAQVVTLTVQRDVPGARPVRGQVVLRNPQAGR